MKASTARLGIDNGVRYHDMVFYSVDPRYGLIIPRNWELKTDLFSESSRHVHIPHPGVRPPVLKALPSSLAHRPPFESENMTDIFDDGLGSP